MLDIDKLRKYKKHTIISLGSYPAINQAMLDFDFLSGRGSSIKAIIATGRRSERYFFGKKEILIPVFPSLLSIPKEIKEACTLFFNNASGRRVLDTTTQALDLLPNILGGVIFAENVPEEHSLSLYRKIGEQGRFLVGPSSVGLLIPQIIKLGAIGGTDIRQLISAKVTTPGNIAVFSSSGGMTNELINLVASTGHRMSFALSFGGDRFPITSPLDAFLAAEKDKDTQAIVYFGELGGFDEYEIVDAIKTGKITKPIAAYIAGVVSEMFATPPQFGHAKAMAGRMGESSRDKRKALKEAGVKVGESFTDFVELVKKLPLNTYKDKDYTLAMEDVEKREHALIASSISGDIEGEPQVLGEDLLKFAKENSFAKIVSSMFLGKKIKSGDTEKFVDFVLRLLVDHGPYVSGAVNTIVTARAGRDLVSSLSAGLLTVGPRFGGAINQAAGNWLKGALSGQSAFDFVEEFASKKAYIPGIGHKKYRIDKPDPRVREILKYAPGKKQFTKFALEVEKITTAKKGNLILNVDGAIAGVMLDILAEKEGYTSEELQRLVETEFFNALFVLSRSVGFIAHFLDQKRLDEGLFRLSEDMVAKA